MYTISLNFGKSEEENITSIAFDYSSLFFHFAPHSKKKKDPTFLDLCDG